MIVMEYDYGSMIVMEYDYGSMIVMVYGADCTGNDWVIG